MELAMRATHRVHCLFGMTFLGLLGGCGSQTSSPDHRPDAMTAAEIPSVQAPPNLVIDHNGLFFDDVAPQTGEPLDLSPEVLRGRWVAFRSPAGSGENLITASVFYLSFGSSGEPAWTLNEREEVVNNPDGFVSVGIDGFERGMAKSSMAWGLNDVGQRGWIASLSGADGPPYARSLEFELVRSDLLHVFGQTDLGNAMTVGLDVLLLPINEYYYLEPPPPITFITDEYVPVPLADDPLLEAESVVSCMGTWTIASAGRKTTLVIGDHRVLRMSQQYDGNTIVEDHLLQYNPVEKSLEIQGQRVANATLGPIDEHGLGPKSASLRLTSSGRLLYQAQPTSGVLLTRVDAPED
jgi:hypothetical protein